MERRLAKLEVVYRRHERRQRPEEPITWRQVPSYLPECFTAMTEAEQGEWGELMTQYSEPGAYHRHEDDRAFFRRLAELDNLIDWHVGEPQRWPAR
jgi:hypothetical protein